MRKKLIYLDCASTTPLDPSVRKAMLPFLGREFGNPSSVYSLGQTARAAVEKAREQVAGFLSCSANEVVFTSGATEANNLAIQGCVKPGFTHSSVPHVITSAIEHESVLAPIQELEKRGEIKATYISVGKKGILDPVDVEKAIKENTVLVSIQYANSEIGTIQPIAEIGNRLKSKVKSQKSKVIFHTDAVQAANYIDCNVGKLGVDLLTLSSHKVYGPKGAGVLYVRSGVLLQPLLRGGGQERGMRPGTENAACIVGMGEAIGEIRNPKSEIRNIMIRQLRDKLIKDVLKRVSGAKLTGSLEHRLANNAHFLFEGIEGKDIVFLLDEKGIAVSTGSACSELTQEVSHVLLAMGYTKKEAAGALRITLGKHAKKEDIEKTVKALEKAVEQLAPKK